MVTPVLFFVVVLLALSVLLISWRIESVVVDLKTTREWMQIKGVTDDIDDSFQVGLSVYDMKGLQAQLEAMRSKTPDLIGAAIVDEQGELIAGANKESVLPLIKKSWTAQLLGKRDSGADRNRHRLREGALFGKSITDPSGNVVAVIWALYSEKTVAEVGNTMLKDLIVPTAIAGLVLLMLGVTAAVSLSRISEARLNNWLDAVGQAPHTDPLDHLLTDKKL